jgi:hypothetical protein
VQLTGRIRGALREAGHLWRSVQSLARRYLEQFNPYLGETRF